MIGASSMLTHRLEGEGEGSPILFLNGGFMTFSSWDPVAEPLRSAHRLLFCDLRGQILSPGPSHYRLEDNVADVEALLDHLGLARVHVLATSFGAFVGLRLAAARPDRVRSMIAVTTTDRATEEMIRGVEQLRQAVDRILAGGSAGVFQDLLVAEVYSPSYVEARREEFASRREQMDKLPKSWFAGLDGIISCTQDVDLRPYLASIRCPTLVIHAGLDKIISRERSQALAAAIDGAEIREHPTSGHALVAEDPVWLADACAGFLARVDQD